jgi:hypothetical protein
LENLAANHVRTCRRVEHVQVADEREAESAQKYIRYVEIAVLDDLERHRLERLDGLALGVRVDDVVESALHAHDGFALVRGVHVLSLRARDDRQG